MARACTATRKGATAGIQRQSGTPQRHTGGGSLHERRQHHNVSTRRQVDITITFNLNVKPT
ncbi:hypothetical protein CITRIK5_30589 [Citricoccus sp. K5]|nr:hypothetical protein CITRIK5_30589 [Citricoccus sp. K5]